MDKQILQLEQKLRDRMPRLLSEVRECPFVDHVFSRIQEKRWHAFLCGGAIRDLMLSHMNPKDLDIIVNFISLDELHKVFQDIPHRFNRFGGLVLQSNSWAIDVWPLRETWAFREKTIPCNRDLAAFPETTFLNMDAVAVEIFPKKGKKRAIYSKGFFEGLLRRTLDINLSENPYPETCIVKALLLANRWRFSMGSRLVHYISEQLGRLDTDYLYATYKKHSGKEWNRSQFDKLMIQIKEKRDGGDLSFGLTMVQKEFEFAFPEPSTKKM